MILLFLPTLQQVASLMIQVIWQYGASMLNICPRG